MSVKRYGWWRSRAIAALQCLPKQPPRFYGTGSTPLPLGTCSRVERSCNGLGKERVGPRPGRRGASRPLRGRWGLSLPGVLEFSRRRVYPFTWSKGPARAPGQGHRISASIRWSAHTRGRSAVQRSRNVLAVPLAALLVAACATTSVHAPPASSGMSSSRLQALTSRIRDDVARGEYPGAVLVVVRDGKTVLSEAFGAQDPTTGAPMRPDSVFRIASMTKPVVSVAVLALVEDGKIGLGDPSLALPPRAEGAQGRRREEGRRGDDGPRGGHRRAGDDGPGPPPPHRRPHLWNLRGLPRRPSLPGGEAAGPAGPDERRVHPAPGRASPRAAARQELAVQPGHRRSRRPRRAGLGQTPRRVPLRADTGTARDVEQRLLRPGEPTRDGSRSRLPSTRTRRRPRRSGTCERGRPFFPGEVGWCPPQATTRDSPRCSSRAARSTAYGSSRGSRSSS